MKLSEEYEKETGKLASHTFTDQNGILFTVLSKQFFEWVIKKQSDSIEELRNENDELQDRIRAVESDVKFLEGNRYP